MDNENCERLYRLYFMKVYSFAISLGASKSNAEEIAQETFFKSLTTKSEYRGEAEEFSWLCSIAKNIFFDEIRKTRKSGEIENDIDSGVDIEKELLDADDTIRIHKALHSLPEPYKEVFELRVFGELSFADIGKIFSKSESWARVTYHRAKLKINERMGK